MNEAIDPILADGARELAVTLGGEDYTDGERAILARLEELERKTDAMLAVFEKLSELMEGFQGKSLLDVLRGK